MFGLGTALAYAPPMGVAMRWFPKQKGLVNGVIVGGFGAGAFIFNQVRFFTREPEPPTPIYDLLVFKSDIRNFLMCIVYPW